MKRFFYHLPPGARGLVLLFAAGYPLALAAQRWTGFDAYATLGLAPAAVFRGEVWRLVSYAFLPGGVIDWLISLFWLATLISVLGRHWSGRELWLYCLLGALVGGVAGSLLLFRSAGLVGSGAILFALLAAWFRLYGSERLILLGFGELSVRQATGLVAGIEVLLLLFGVGVLGTVAMLTAGGTGWLYLVLRGRQGYHRGASLGSERIARLEL